jgi:Amt family ammonium transporter
MNSGDTAWVLASSALVMLMTVGLAIFYGGMVRAKNVLSTVMHSFFALGLVSFLWIVCAYSFSFGPSFHGIIGNFQYVFGHDVTEKPNAFLAPTIPHMAFASFQLMFAIITPALISGAFAERIKFSSYAVFTAVWLVVVYAPIAHWIFDPDGWLHKLGALDFAGGTVVHMNAGAAALAAAIVLGRRKGFGREAFVPHNLPLTVLGAGLLWFGWFGFNAGSALAANGLAASAFLVTNTGAAMGALGWAFYEILKDGKPTVLGVASGGVAGLVAITPASGYVGIMGAVAIGLLAGIVCAWAVRLKFRLGFDDALDAVGVHLVGGMVGALLTGVFADLAINSLGADGLASGGGFALLGKQAIAVGVTLVYSFGLSWAIFKAIDVTMGLRVTEQEEVSGLDLALHSEVGYSLSDGLGSSPASHPPAPAPSHAPSRVPVTGEA